MGVQPGVCDTLVCIPAPPRCGRVGGGAAGRAQGVGLLRCARLSRVLERVRRDAAAAKCSRGFWSAGAAGHVAAAADERGHGARGRLVRAELLFHVGARRRLRLLAPRRGRGRRRHRHRWRCCTRTPRCAPHRSSTQGAPVLCVRHRRRRVRRAVGLAVCGAARPAPRDRRAASRRRAPLHHVLTHGRRGARRANGPHRQLLLRQVRGGAAEHCALQRVALRRFRGAALRHGALALLHTEPGAQLQLGAAGRALLPARTSGARARRRRRESRGRVAACSPRRAVALRRIAALRRAALARLLLSNSSQGRALHVPDLPTALPLGRPRPRRNEGRRRHRDRSPALASPALLNAAHRPAFLNAERGHGCSNAAHSVEYARLCVLQLALGGDARSAGALLR
eukprot:6185347-Pleurochrysis_carterae.AAC.1